MYSGTDANFSALTPTSMAGTIMTDWPEWYSLSLLGQQTSQALTSYNATLWGSSGNMTINGVSTNSCTTNSTTTSVAKRGVGARWEVGVNITNPPYAIHNGDSIYDTPRWADRHCSYWGPLYQDNRDERHPPGWLRRTRCAQHVWTYGGENDTSRPPEPLSRTTTLLDQSVDLRFCRKVDRPLGELHFI